MKTFEAQAELNENRTHEGESINFECESFDFDVFESRELVNVSLGEMIFECLVSSLEIQMAQRVTSVVFIPFRRIK